jgi:ribosomal protein S18 acetylase RimI-like enzyme
MLTSIPHDIVVRRAGIHDAPVLVQFNRALARETEGKALLPAVVAQGVKALLESHELGFYVVAEKNGNLVGSLMITTEWSDWRNGHFWWIQSVYVRPDHRRHGIYRCLYRFVQGLASEDSSVRGFRLYVERENVTAQSAYEALGMEEAPYRMFEAFKDETRDCDERE